jgi:hypothetical protein
MKSRLVAFMIVPPNCAEKSRLIFRGERQQHIAGHAAIPGISGIDEDHAAHDDRAGSVE